MTDYPIDFVVTWVDGLDATWRKKKNKRLMEYDLPTLDSSEERYREWGLFKYWFRAVEKYAPWVNKIFVITDNQWPEWMNTLSEKLVCVNHEDYLNIEDLPVFNSNAIELRMCFIKDLSEHFVYFNDDMFLNAPCSPDDFFYNGLPKDMLCLQPIIANANNPTMSYTFLNNSLVLAKHFDKKTNIRKQLKAYYHLGYPLKYFGYNILEYSFPQTTGYFSTHGPAALLKSHFLKVWQEEESVLNATCTHPFRSKEDVNIYLIREWQKLDGNFKAANILKNMAYFEINDNNEKLIDCVLKGKKKIICLNDVYKGQRFNIVKNELIEVFAKKYPSRSIYEV